MTDTPDYTAARDAIAAAADDAYAIAARMAKAAAESCAAARAYAAHAAAADQAIVAEAIATHGADASRVYREAEARHTEEAQWCDSASDERRKLELAGSYGRIAAMIEAATGKA
jgi:hypothetical protein